MTLQRTFHLNRLAAFAAIFVVMLAVPSALAHSSQTNEDGRIRVSWGMTDEPATTDSKNGLDFILRYAENSTGIMGAHEMGLTVTLSYADEVLPITLTPQHNGEAEGRYTHTSPITLSQSGIYVLRVSGTIDGSVVDMEIPGHDVHDLSESYFPPRDDASTGNGNGGGDTSALEARIAALEAKVAALEADAQTQSERTVTPTSQTGDGGSGGNGTPGLGTAALLGVIGIVAFAATRRRG